MRKRLICTSAQLLGLALSTGAVLAAGLPGFGTFTAARFREASR
jgi:hypothetical protein